MIGKKWLDSSDDSGKRRLDNREDFVRMETAAALRREIFVNPMRGVDHTPFRQFLPPFAQ
jgi:hypothetical protein